MRRFSRPGHRFPGGRIAQLERIRIDRAKPRSDPFVGRARSGALGAPLQISFLDLLRKHEFRRAGSGKPRRAAAQAAKIVRIWRFLRPVCPIGGGRLTQLGETEVPNTAGQRSEGGLHDQTATATSGGAATTVSEGDRIRVLTIAITAPQHGQSIAGRSCRGGVKRLGSNLSKRCSKAIRRLQLARRKPKLRARRKPLGKTCWTISQRKSVAGSERFSRLPV